MKKPQIPLDDVDPRVVKGAVKNALKVVLFHDLPLAVAAMERTASLEAVADNDALERALDRLALIAAHLGRV